MHMTIKIKKLICILPIILLAFLVFNTAYAQSPEAEYNAYEYNSVKDASQILGDLRKNGSDYYINGPKMTYAVYNNVDFGECGSDTLAFTYTNGNAPTGTVCLYIFDQSIDDGDTPDLTSLSSLGTVKKSNGSIITGKRLFFSIPPTSGDWTNPQKSYLKLNGTITGVKTVMVCRNWCCDMYGILFKKCIDVSITNVTGEYLFENNVKKLKITVYANILDDAEIAEYGVKIKPAEKETFQYISYSGYDNKIFGNTSFGATLAAVPWEYNNAILVQAYITVIINNGFKTIYSETYYL